MNLTDQSKAPLERTDLPLDISRSGGWFVEEQGRVDGPYADEVFHQKIANNEITDVTYCWRLGFSEWVKFGSLLQRNNHQSNSQTYPSDIFPLSVLLSLIICFTVFFVVDSNKKGSFAAKAQSNVPTSQSTKELLTLKICNDSKHGKVFAAVAYYDHKIRDWVARGWYPQKKDECKVVLQNLVPPVYGFAETKSSGHSWKDSGNFQFCIAGKNAFVNPQSPCSESPEGSRLQNFELLEINGDDHTIEWRIQ